MAKQTFTTGQVLTAAQMTSLQQTAMGGGSATAKTTSYVLVAADAGTTVIMNSGSATTITVNTSLFSAGDSVFIQNIGAGICTVTAGTATVSTAGSLALGQYEGGILYFTATGSAIFHDYYQSSGSASGLTFIHRSSFTNVATVDYDYFTSSYYNYLVIVESIKSASASGGSESLLQMRYSTSTETGAVYNGSSWSTDRTGTGAGLGYNSQTAAKLALDIGDTNENSYVINFERVGNASENPSFSGTGVLGDTTYGSVTFGGKAYQARTYTGFRLLASSGNISGTVSIYGLAKS